MDSKKLSIVIPTRNRPCNLNEVVFSLMTQLEFLGFESFELIVSDNSSNDETQHIINKLTQLFSKNTIYYWRTPVQFESAEEHLSWLFEKEFGEFVWFLGDDDLPMMGGLRYLVETLNSEKVHEDLLVFHCAREYQGKYVSLNNFPFNGVAEETNLIDCTLKYGIWSEVCGISNQVLRSDKISAELLRNIIRDCGAFYSHMTHNLAQFGKSRMKLVYEPLVIYHLNNLNTGDSSEWQEPSKRINTPFYHPWLLSFARQIVFLEEMRIIDNNYLQRVIDYEVGMSSKFVAIPLAGRLNWIASQQKSLWVSDSSQPKYSKEQLDWLLKFFVERLPHYQLTWFWAFGESKSDRHFNHYSVGAFDSFWISKYRNFYIYKTGDKKFFAVAQNLKNLIPQIYPVLDSFCASHVHMGVSLDSIFHSIDSSSSDNCTCFTFEDYIEIPMTTDQKYGKTLFYIYSHLPKKVKSHIRRAINSKLGNL